MSGHHQRKVREEDVESILRDFFRNEMPAELRRPEFAGRATPVTAAQPAGNRAALTGVIVAACSLLLAVTIFSSGKSPDRSSRATKASTAGDLVKGDAAKSDANSNGPAIALKKKKGASPLPRRFVPVELQWMREVHENLRNSFFGDYFPHAFNADDWSLQGDIELQFPHEKRGATKPMNPEPTPLLPELR